MASFEQRDLVDYIMKKYENIVNEVFEKHEEAIRLTYNIENDYMRNDLDKLWVRVRKIEDKMKKSQLRLENLENRVRVLEECLSSEE